MAHFYAPAQWLRTIELGSTSTQCGHKTHKFIRSQDPDSAGRHFCFCVSG
jgi:hypothetical protein